MQKVNLKLGIHRKNTPISINTWIQIGHLISQATTKEELSKIVLDRVCPTWIMIDKKQYEEISNLATLKERLIVHIVARRIKEILHKEQSIRGPKSDRMRRFFNELTTEHQDIFDVMELYGLSYNTIKNHRRYDLFPERGITKIKNDKIFRMENACD